jgi:ribosomal protein S18 acetylase RimI-like enzyme
MRDLDAINELTLEMHNHLGKLVGIKFDVEELREEMYENEQDLENVYVAEFNGEVVGYMAFSRRMQENEFFGKFYHLYHVAVKHEFRMKGVASKLFNMLLRKAKRERVSIVTETFCLNKEGLNFYRKMGFKPIETVLILNHSNRLKL